MARNVLEIFYITLQRNHESCSVTAGYRHSVLGTITIFVVSKAGRPAISDISCTGVFTWNRTWQLTQSAKFLAKGEVATQSVKKKVMLTHLSFSLPSELPSKTFQTLSVLSGFIFACLKELFFTSSRNNETSQNEKKHNEKGCCKQSCIFLYS